MNIPDEPTDPNRRRRKMKATEAGSSGSAVPLTPAPADPVDQTVRLTRSVTRRMGLQQPNLDPLSSRAPARNETPRVPAANPVNEPDVKRQKQRRFINVDLLQPPQKRPAPERNQPTYLEEEEEEKQTSVQPAPRGKQTTAQDNQLPPAEDPDSREAGFRLRYPNVFHDPQANPVPVPFPRTARYPFESPVLQLLESMEEQMKRTEIEMLKRIEAQLGFKSEDIEFENDSVARRLTLLEEKMDKVTKA